MIKNQKADAAASSADAETECTALVEGIDACQKYNFDTCEFVECKWELWDRIRAALAQPSVPAGWQPIETAPKDYTVVLLYQPAGPGNAEGVGQGHRTSLSEHAHDKWMFQATGWIAEPTHWMPLPEPPTDQAVRSAKPTPQP